MVERKQEIKQLIFIYNANAGKHEALFDIAHKLVSPQTYDCKLCDITYGIFTEKKVWKKYRKAAKVPMKFLHKNEFSKMYSSKFGFKTTYPVVLAQTEYALEFFIHTEELNSLENVADLMKLVNARLD